MSSIFEARGSNYFLSVLVLKSVIVMPTTSLSAILYMTPSSTSMLSWASFGFPKMMYRFFRGLLRLSPNHFAFNLGYVRSEVGGYNNLFFMEIA